MAKVRCPGSMKTMVPEPLERKCPKCGSMIEIWSDEEKADCKCGETVFKDKAPTCVVWCGVVLRKNAWATFLMLKRCEGRCEEESGCRRRS